MSSFYSVLVCLACFQLTAGIALILAMRRAGEGRTYWPLALVISSICLPSLLLFVLRELHFAGYPLRGDVAYILYFWTFWGLFLFQAIGTVFVIYNIFNSAMQHLKGLQDLGRIMFQWVAGISLALAISGSLVPHASSTGMVIVVVSQVVRSTSILVVSLLIFVCLCIKPMGLSLRNRVFGISVGLSITALTSIVQTGFISNPRDLFNGYALVQAISECVAECIWIYYFVVPEPKRKFILLPTTSPFHKWNMISEMLGHEPGYVAIGGVAPEHFASAEIEIFHRASAKMPKLAVPTVPQPVSPEEWLRSGDN